MTKYTAHEQNYRAVIRPTALIHQHRLSRILGIIRSLDLGEEGTLADFGCANGFILEQIRLHAISSGWKLVGLDRRWLDAAKEIESCEFFECDLNHAAEDWKDAFDVVTCFETFEHVGDFRKAVSSVCAACKPGGYALFSVPNETGVFGTAKFLGRMFRIRDKTEKCGVLRDTPKSAYFRGLLSGEDLEQFRQPPREIWGSHLGFDVRRFEEHIDESVCSELGFCRVSMAKVAFGFGRIYLLRRNPAN